MSFSALMIGDKDHIMLPDTQEKYGEYTVVFEGSVGMDTCEYLYSVRFDNKIFYGTARRLYDEPDGDIWFIIKLFGYADKLDLYTNARASFGVDAANEIKRSLEAFFSRSDMNPFDGIGNSKIMGVAFIGDWIRAQPA